MPILAPSSVHLRSAAPRGLLRDARGATAIEFALVAPDSFLLTFGTAELALMTWFSGIVSDGAVQAGQYLRVKTMKCMWQGLAPDPTKP